MKKILILITAISLLTSCWIEKEKSSFEKKKECISLENEIRNQLESNERYWNRIESSSLYLSEIFYSPLRDSCLYVSEFINDKNYNLEINDYFTKEILFQKLCTSWEWYDFSNCSKVFNNELKKYK